MPKITKIYTRTGDDGSTALGSKLRVSKDHLRIEAYGTVDELNSVLGIALTTQLDAGLAQQIQRIQNELFHLGSDLAFPPEDKTQVPRIQQGHIDALEQAIDDYNQIVGPLSNFILPGGCSGAAHLQFARAVCRRAERTLVSLAQTEAVTPLSLAYLNRLSDALFVMARYENHQKGITEPLWNSRA